MRRKLWPILKILLCCGLFIFCLIWAQQPEFFNFGLPDLDGMRRELDPRVNSSIKGVDIRDDLLHYINPMGGIDPEYVAAHCHRNGQICMKSYTMGRSRSAFWHEAGHAYTFHLWHKGSGFFQEWESVGPLGTLTAYGETSPWEDVAEWVKHIYLNVNGYYSEFSSLWLWRFVKMAPIEPYRKKLELLRKYGFISEEDYQIFIENNPSFAPEATPRKAGVFVIMSA